ncbi:MAG: HAMP domain-containing protein [Leptothrix sp. (in: Bacteria)]|nr:HAMP domain-containing protein [Leptothrix sp. (in: b-proteobacteria)]
MTRRSLRWTLLVATLAAGATALVLAFLLSLATGNRELYERHFGWILWVNIAVAILLGLVILIALGHLARRMRHGKFGSRLLLKMAAIFAFVGAVPGLLIYGVSYQFVSRSIESWFDVEVEDALEAGLNLGRGTLQLLANDVGQKTRVAVEQRAAELGRQNPLLALERLRQQLGAQSVALLGPQGQLLASSGGDLGVTLLPPRPSASLLRLARQSRVTAVLDGLDDDRPNPTKGAPAAAVQASVRVLAWLPSSDYSLLRDDRFLQVTTPIAPELAGNALRVQHAYLAYQQLALGRQGLRKMYIGTLTLTLILGVFAALLMAAALGHQIGRPLVMLAEGVRRVARGDLSRTEVFASRDELGGLTRAFADMTRQLGDSHSIVQRSLAEVESAKTHLQTLLDNLSSGVILFDAAGRIGTVNPGAGRILRVPLDDLRGRFLADVPDLATLAAEVEARFTAHAQELEPGSAAASDHWQATLELGGGGPVDASAGARTVLLLRGAYLPDGARLVIVDDITDVVSAQRSVAWAEVARRVAHEIKNPLTPIQLSAERLEHKLGPRLSGPDQQMLERCVRTIVAQVQAMKTLVNEFRDYARLPAAKLQPLDLNALVGEVLGLYAAPQEQGQLRAGLGSGLPPILGDASQLRQVIHNLVQNGLDAVADRPDGRVQLRTEALRDGEGRLRAVRLKVCDNGPGFAETLLKRAFEPYVTTKAKGTGLGLAVVRKIVEEHGARIRLGNLADETQEAGTSSALNGAEVSISFSRWSADPGEPYLVAPASPAATVPPS